MFFFIITYWIIRCQILDISQIINLFISINYKLDNMGKKIWHAPRFARRIPNFFPL